MKRNGIIMLILSLVTFLSFFGIPMYKPVDETPGPTAQRINPGDRIGDFLITTGGDEKIFYIAKTHCSFDVNNKTETCQLPVGTMVNVGLGIYGDNAPKGKTVEDYWTDLVYEMSIDNFPVNLQAFGTVDFTTRSEGAFLVWNVVIMADKPGTISTHSTGVVGGQPFDYTARVTFTGP